MKESCSKLEQFYVREKGIFLSFFCLLCFTGLTNYFFCDKKLRKQGKVPLKKSLILLSYLIFWQRIGFFYFFFSVEPLNLKNKNITDTYKSVSFSTGLQELKIKETISPPQLISNLFPIC
jgi:hypothetical protein